MPNPRNKISFILSGTRLRDEAAFKPNARLLLVLADS
jgi:hypothetical protein